MWTHLRTHVDTLRRHMWTHLRTYVFPWRMEMRMGDGSRMRTEAFL
jgi:hypothetical protein